jgi:hypothetical protein
VRDLLVNLLASIVAGAAVWLAQRMLSYRRLARKRAFFGLEPGAGCLFVVGRHAASPHDMSVHRRDVAALVELATIAKECGARAELVADEDIPQGIGRVTEFCVGGELSNPRAGAHFRALLPGVRFAPFNSLNKELSFTVGTETFRREPDRIEYVVLGRAWAPSGSRPVFIIGGQTARTNLAAARFLAGRYRELSRRYGALTPFCVVLRIVEPAVYGPDYVEIVADVSADSFQ